MAALVGTFFTDVSFVELLEEIGLGEAEIAAGIGATEEPVLPASFPHGKEHSFAN